MHIGIVTLANLRELFADCMDCRVVASGWALVIAWKSTVGEAESSCIALASRRNRALVTGLPCLVMYLMSLMNCKIKSK